MASFIAKRMRKAASILLAGALAASMVPTSALAEVEGSAQSTVRVEVIGSLRVASVSTWSGAITIAESHQSAFGFPDGEIGRGVIWAAFEYGTPIPQAGTSGYYEASWQWERSITDGTSTTTTKGHPIEKSVEAAADGRSPVAALTMDEMFAAQGWTADSLRAGDYTVTLTLAGEGCQASHTFTFSIINADSVLSELTDESTHVTIYGAFNLTSELRASDLVGATSAEQASLMDALTQAAAPATVGAAFQLSIVNGGLFYDDAPSFLQERVSFPVSAEVMGAIAEQRDLTMLRSSGGSIVAETYRYDASSATYKRLQGDGTLAEEGALEIASEGAGGRVGYAMPFASADIGAVALAYAPPATYTITVEMAGSGAGIASPSAPVASYGAGSSPAYAFVADAGSVLAKIEVLAESGAAYPADKYTLTADAVRFTSLDADVRIRATFEPYAPPTDPDDPDKPASFALSFAQAPVAGALSVGYVRLIGGATGQEQQDATRTITSAADTISDALAGSEVRIDISAPEGYVIEGVWACAADTPAAEQTSDRFRLTVKGTTLVIPTITADTARITVRYVPGEKPPVVSRTLTAIIDGDPLAGSFPGLQQAGSGRYTATMAQGDYQVIEVVAASGWAIEEVALYEGPSAQGDPRILFAAAPGASKRAFSYTIPFVESDYTAVARFAKDEGDAPIVIPDPEQSFSVTAKVNGAGGTISPAGTQLVRAGADQTFTLIPASGYKVSRVTANGRVVGTTQHASGYSSFTAYAISSNMTIIATFERADDAPAITEQPYSVTAKSVGLGRAWPSTAKVAQGGTFTLTLEPDAGCALKSLTLNGQDVTSAVARLAYTVEHVEGDLAFVATFVDAAGSTIAPPAPGGDIDIDVDIDIEVEVGRARTAAADEVGGEVSPMHVTIKPDQTQRFIIKPYDGSYVSAVAASGAQIVSQGPIDMGEVLPHPDGVNKPYYAVELGQFSGTSVKLSVKFASCYSDPANTNGDRYVYDQAAGRVVDVSPGIDGEIEVEYPGNNSEGVVGDVVDVVVRPDGPDPIERIEMLGHTIDIVRDASGNITEVIVDRDSADPAFPPASFEVDPIGDKAAEADALKQAAEELNRRIDAALGYEPPRGSGEGGRPDYVTPGTDENGTFDGSFDIKAPTADKDGNRIDPDVEVSTGGTSGVLYQYLVRVGFADDSEQAAGSVRIERNGDDLGELDARGTTVPMNHEGALTLHAAPNAGYGVRFIVEDGEGNIRASDSSTVSLADEGTTTQSYVVTGPGDVRAQFFRTTPPDSSGSSSSGSSAGSSAGSSDSSSSGSSSSGGTSAGDGTNAGDGSPDATLGAADVAAGRAWAITASAKGAGTISPSGTNYYRTGASASFNLVPQSGYQVSAVVVDGTRRAWSATKLTLEAQAAGTTHTVVAEFSPVYAAAGSTSSASRAIRTLTSLAQTSDGQAALALMIAAAGCAAMGAAVLVSNRRRRDQVQGAHAEPATQE